MVILVLSIVVLVLILILVQILMFVRSQMKSFDALWESAEHISKYCDKFVVLYEKHPRAGETVWFVSPALMGGLLQFFIGNHP